MLGRQRLLVRNGPAPQKGNDRNYGALHRLPVRKVPPHVRSKGIVRQKSVKIYRTCDCLLFFMINMHILLWEGDTDPVPVEAFFNFFLDIEPQVPVIIGINPYSQLQVDRTVTQ